MLKKLFDFKVSKELKIAKIVMIIGMLAAIVITALGIQQIMDVKAMKEILGVPATLSRLNMGAVLVFLLEKYLVWALLILAVTVGGYLFVRYQSNKKAAA